jgi:nucleoside-diphosphate-sugar epimerase
MSLIDGARVLITGGTGSLGTALVKRLLSGKDGKPESVTVYSRDELKQADMRTAFPDKRMCYIIGDIRDYHAVVSAVSGADILFNAAALKRVETCEKFPDEAISTNYIGASNIVRAIREMRCPVKVVIGVGSDKGCLDWHSPVKLWHGATMPIAELVKNKYNGLVQSYDGTGRIINKKVIGWYKIKNLFPAMYHLSYKHMIKEHGHIGRGVLLTPDHLVLTPTGWAKVESLVNGNLIVTGERAPNKKQMGLLLGSLLGDASFGKLKSIRYGHCENQRVILDLWVDALRNIGALHDGVMVRKDHRQNLYRAKVNANAVTVKLKNDIQSGELIKMMSKYFSPLLLAIWYMDDGCLDKKYARLAVCNYGNNTISEMVNLLNRKGLECHEYYQRQYGKEYGTIRFSIKGTLKLMEMIGAYVPAELRYKIFDTCAAFDPTLWRLGESEVFVDEAIIEIRKSPTRDVYCIDVEDTHNFIVNNMVLHNCQPLNVYGATKSLQEHRLLVANYECPHTRFVGVRYGNVMASRGSVIPIWQEQIRQGKPITITDPAMTRFLISLDQAVDTLLAVLEYAERGEVYIPHLPAAAIGNMARVLVENHPVVIEITGKGFGEKMHEVLITEEEANRTVARNGYYVVTQQKQAKPAIDKEYISRDCLVSSDKLKKLFIKYGLMADDKVEVKTV